MRTLSRDLTSIAMSLLLAACGAAATPSATPAPTGTSAPTRVPSTDLLADIDVGGRTLHVVCVGPLDSGKPVVIFEAGLGGDLGQWSDVLKGVAPVTRACAYDRAGDGQSPVPAAPITTRDQVADVRALLAALELPPPYVLVGYSLGGWNVMVHADEHPDDVVGVVMVEVRPPGLSEAWLAALPPAASGEPEAVTANRDDLTVFEADPTLNPELIDLRASAAEAIATEGFGDTPLVVLVDADDSGLTEGLPDDLAATFHQIAHDLDAELAARSSSSRVVRVEGTSHDMPWQKPDVIVDAILELLGT